MILPKSFRAGLAKWLCLIMVLTCLIDRQQVIMETLASFQQQQQSQQLSYDSFNTNNNNNNNNNTIRATTTHYRNQFMVNISYHWASSTEKSADDDATNNNTGTTMTRTTTDRSFPTTTTLSPLPFFVTESNLTGHVDPSTGRLTVHVNHTYAFWQQGQSKLCQLLRNMTYKVSLEDEYYDGGGGTSPSPPPLPLLNMTIDCEWLATNEGYGQGNWVTALYAVRMATTLAQVDFQFQCTTRQASRSTLLLPWLEGYYPGPTPSNNDQRWPYDDGENVPTQAQVCSDKYYDLRIDKLAHEIQSDMRKMTQTILLQQENNHNDDIVLDDVAIHFRCGDIMGGVKRSDFGMIQFSEYLKWIPTNTTNTIGILTQPFEKDRNRAIDGRKSEDCRQATYLLVDYLQAHYPHTRISIRNDRNETLPITYARLVGAKQSFTSLSSFGIFPVIGTRGEGYFQRGNRGVNPFAKYIPNYLSNIHEMNAPKLSSAQILQMGLNATLAWFVNGTTTVR